ncbi:HD family phosphohydrolase [Clostridium butyricum]|uniref:Metal dependent phosphohydrolase n=1 Tax=Clostridium butyricum E4 str. BoNT E BL5262 TaxID=632245 RepID=C4IDE7_CLOBU|nr:HD family phosphohydrolase [Clostridium butyricum]APF23518.1 HDIG domain protein [Clostridium butyricum]EDT75328.1 membrane protein containing HD superfamily hydrolase domain [Clostridium butyricum 5521]EEP55365.1 metal dependent phosphohydrolase [Clostridium butyricum E4 str. BoNT E BL5262]NFL31237.1 HD family phosphohydrolase [Clostridium butyricum]NFS18271.1 HD family phosphohydrolase [Clostridium butyricum]
MKVKQDINIKKRNNIRRILLFVSVFVLSYLLLITAIKPQQYSLEVGDIPRSDIKAPRDTIDERATKEAEDKALEKVDKQYTQKAEVKKQAEDNVILLFEKLNTIINNQSAQTATSTSVESNVSELKKIEGIALSEDEYKELLNIPKEQLSSLQKDILNIIDKTYEKNINEKDDESLNIARDSAVSLVEKLNLADKLKYVFEELVKGQINPNCFYDEEKTQELIDETRKSVAKVVIKQNQIIVKEGVPVTQNELDILSDLGMLDDGKNTSIYLYVYIVLAMFVGIIMFLQYNYIDRNYSEIFKNTKKITLISVINLMTLVFARTIGLVSPYLIPFACAPILLTLLINYKISIVISILNVIVISIATGFDAQVMMLGVISSILGATLLKKMQQRNELLYSTIYLSIVGVIITVSTGILISSNLREVLIKSGITFIGGVLSGIFALGILPFLEGTFNEVTTLKLLELSNPNHPLLKKLLMEAPGTYHHSMLVANLAEMASEEVGANSVIVRIGSYYHDVGKTERPYFFGENQMGGENPHNHMTPNLSAKIIISHVKDGIELARKYNLPKVIQDIIGEHHGTTLVKYFYYTMKNNSENPEEVKEEDYRYPGPIPNSKEAGIIMLADSVEAAVRSIKEPSEDKIKEMINNIISDKLSCGQLNDCNLTIKDIEKIKKCFLTALNGIYHHRIEYPKEKIKSLNEENNDNNKNEEKTK